jgi:hypothetical protein
MGGACSTNGGRRGTHIGCWWESQSERGCQEDQDVGGWIILGWMDWIGLAQDRNRWIALVNLVLKLWVP